jgi:hypothetical protein
LTQAFPHQLGAAAPAAAFLITPQLTHLYDTSLAEAGSEDDVDVVELPHDTRATVRTAAAAMEAKNRANAFIRVSLPQENPDISILA